VLKDKLFITNDGTWSYGTIETINPSIKEDDENGLYFNVPIGYVNNEYN
jgi:hypothetical protein